MKTLVLSIAVLTMTPLVVLADDADPIIIKKGFISGNEYRIIDENGKVAYAIGFIDGVLVSPMFAASKDKLRWIEECATGMTAVQISAIFDKYLSNNPVRWHEPMNMLAWAAMNEACNNN